MSKKDEQDKGINVVMVAERLNRKREMVGEQEKIISDKKRFIKDAKWVKDLALKERMGLFWDMGKDLNDAKDKAEHGQFEDVLKRSETPKSTAKNWRDIAKYLSREEAQDCLSLRKALLRVDEIKNPTKSSTPQDVELLDAVDPSDHLDIVTKEHDTPEQPDTESPDDSDTGDKGDVEPTDTEPEAAEKSKQAAMIDDDLKIGIEKKDTDVVDPSDHLDIVVKTHDGRSSGSDKKVVKSSGSTTQPAEPSKPAKSVEQTQKKASAKSKSPAKSAPKQPAPPSGDKVTLTLVFSDEYGDFLEESGEINRSDVEQMLARIKETDQDLFRLCANFLKSII